MRIRTPPKFIMSTSVIMSLIMTLLVFQCVHPLSQRSKAFFHAVSPRYIPSVRPREPECIAGVCPPGSHFLERRVKVRCNTRRRKNNWCDEFTRCGEELTHRCALCPYWRCADDLCDGAA